MNTELEKKKVPALRFPEFQGEWRGDLLGDALRDIVGGGTPSRDVPAYYEGGTIPWVTVKDLSESNYKRSTEEYITPLGLKNCSAKLIPENQFIISTRMGLGRGFINTVPMSINQDMKALFPNSEILETRFLMLWYKKNASAIDRLGVGSTVKGIDLTTLKKLIVKYPLLPEQQKIADFLTAVDERIQKLSRKKELLQQYKKGVMQQIFSQQIRFKDDNGNNYPDWETALAGKVFSSYSNKNHNGDLPILAATQERGMVKREDIDIKIQSSEASVKSYKIVEKGDFVISLRSFQGGIEYSNVLGICSPAYTVLKPKQEICNQFFKHYFKKEDFITRLSATVVGIRDGKQISYSAFSSMKLTFPCLVEQQKIANYLSSIDDKIAVVNKELEQSQTFKKGLLQQMFV